MRHTKQEVIKRTIQEYKRLDILVKDLSDEEWKRLLPRPETKDPWTVKDSLAHVIHWKADAIRKIKKQPLPIVEKELNWTDGNHLIYKRWRNISPQKVIAWHRQVQKDLLAVLQDATESWFINRERQPEWPFDIDGHSSYHRINDIEHTLKKSSK